jgi:glutaconyl-CoA/methylmalonyl-CoA decarboxylase subunit gamma
VRTTVVIAGQRYLVTIEPAAQSGEVARLLVMVTHGTGPMEESRSFEIDARQTEIGAAFVYLADARSVDAAVTRSSAGRALVQVSGFDVDAEVVRAGGSVSTGSVGQSGEQRLVSPMPGRIVRVLVAPGDDVVAKQGLVVVEAMKMENELTAARPGRVREVAVAEGISVESGRLLVIID